MAKAVFLIRADAIYNDDPTRHYQFPKMYLGRASQAVGDWIVYMEPMKAGQRGYHAVARVDAIVPDPIAPGMYRAMINTPSYLELGRDVPFRVQGEVVERGLLNDDGRVNNGRAVWAVRPLSEADFDRILALGVVTQGELLPRADETGIPLLQEEQSPWEAPVDRETMLVSRTVRDRQFRKRVLEVYDRRCALTGMQLINGGGRAEAQAAHIMSVDAGGPDVVTNGIALSGTVHWMFDRGLISLTDAGEILLSSKINDVDGVTKLLYPDRRARLPSNNNVRPHPRYLEWHRTHHRFAA
jgi:putative restriction endonuclease